LAKKLANLRLSIDQYTMNGISLKGFVLVAGLALVNTGLLSAQTQVGTTAVSFLEVPAGARSLGMGEAYVSVADEISALYWNPAGITASKSNQVTFETTEWFADTRISYTGALIRRGDHYFGANLYLFDGGEMDVTTLTYPDGTGEEFTVQDISLGLSYARRLTDDFSVGGTLKMLQSRIWRMRANSLALDMGFQYKTPFKGLNLGFSISNFGGEMRLEGDNTFVRVDLDPQGAGNNDGIPANLALKSWDLPLIFRLGVNYEIIFLGLQKGSDEVVELKKVEGTSAYYNIGDKDIFVRVKINSDAKKDSPPMTSETKKAWTQPFLVQ
jgi:long-subunit fatty acid transport protein